MGSPRLQELALKHCQSCYSQQTPVPLISLLWGMVEERKEGGVDVFFATASESAFAYVCCEAICTVGMGA